MAVQVSWYEEYDAVVVEDKNGYEAEFHLAEWEEFVADIKSGRVERDLASLRNPRYKGDIS